MRPPNRSFKSIRPLPSLYTTFPVTHDTTYSSIDSGIDPETCMIRQIEDGIEVLPLERCNNLSAPILSPDRDEKEVFVRSQKEIDIAQKPLPRLPTSRWRRLSTRQRILVLLGVQFVMLSTIGLALLATKGRNSKVKPSNVRASGEVAPSNSTIDDLRRGIFALPIRLPQQQSSECLSKMNESAAWQCASDTTFQLNVLPSPQDDDPAIIVTLSTALGNGSLIHGHQVPESSPVELASLEATRTDATYYFRVTYDRIVLLKEDDLTPTETPQSQPVMRHPTFSSGESIWQCVFNGTQMEGYIYVNLPTTSDSRNESTNANSPSSTLPPKSPYVVKLVEQMLSERGSPYCEKRVVQNDGTLSSPSARVLLSLEKSAIEHDVVSSSRGRRKQARRQQNSLHHCRCQWMVQ
ncbi:hypothetical protein ACN47E_004514 [Coniothyrium glycines]